MAQLRGIEAVDTHGLRPVRPEAFGPVADTDVGGVDTEQGAMYGAFLSLMAHCAALYFGRKTLRTPAANSLHNFDNGDFVDPVRSLTQFNTVVV